MSDDQFNDTQEINVEQINATTDTPDLPDEVKFVDRRELILVVRGIVERFVLQDGISILLGRGSAAREAKHHLDLGAYEGSQRGVSRQHATISLGEGNLYVTDLGSTNGTWLSGRRLNPNDPTVINKGDELMLGRLAIQVVFRTTSSGRLKP